MTTQCNLPLNIKVDIGYFDPPYEFKKSGGKTSSRGLAKSFYPTMSIQEICDLKINNKPVKDIFSDNATLFLWIPHSLVIHLKEIYDAWGFTHFGKAFEWRKMEKSGKEFFGMGYRVRANSESCWLAVRGKPKVFAHNVRENFAESMEHINLEHSEKPDIFRDRIVNLCGNLPRLEGFARKQTEGWYYFGNEIKHITQLERKIRNR